VASTPPTNSNKQVDIEQSYARLRLVFEKEETSDSFGSLLVRMKNV